MSGVLHPVGPEPARTYWIRRGILLTVVLVLVLAVVVVVASMTRAAVATAPPPVIVPPSPSAARSVSTGVSTVRVVPATPSATAATPAVTPATAKPTAKPSPATTTIGTPDCRPSALRVTLKGDQTPAQGHRNRFSLSLINGSRVTCLTSVTDKRFELRIYSGKDRIWSSQDCPKLLDDFDKVLAAGARVTWTMTWNGKRSVKGARCETGSPPPRAGTYWATAQFAGAQPVRLRMIIR